MAEVPQKVTVPVGITFDPCQGLREAKQKIAALKAKYGDEMQADVVFDARHLELISEYATIGKELFDPEQTYVTSQGGLLNLTVPINLLRVYGTLSKWSQLESERTGTEPISQFISERPSSQTPVGQLWDVLNMEGLTKWPLQNTPLLGVMEFQSRYVTPLLYVTKNDASQTDIKKSVVQQYLQRWVLEIEDRLGEQEESHELSPLTAKLLQAIPEIVNNIVTHGGGGLIGLSVWLSGQIEIIWSNPLDKTDPPWPPGDAPLVLAESLRTSRSGGAGIKFICDDLLKKYSGVLTVNWKTYHIAFRSGGDVSVFGLYPRGIEFVPRSILFSLHLFSEQVREKSSKK